MCVQSMMVSVKLLKQFPGPSIFHGVLRLLLPQSAGQIRLSMPGLHLNQSKQQPSHGEYNHITAQ